MTSHETAIAERLHAAADRIPVDTGVPPTVETGRTLAPSRSGARRRVVVAAVAVAASAAAVTVVVSTRPTSETVKAGSTSSEVPVTPSPSPAPAPCPPAPESPTSCSPLVAAHLAEPPAWFGEPQGGFHTMGFRSGRWVSMAIGRESGDTVTDPIVVSAFDGTYGHLDGAETVTIGGRSLRSVELEDWDWRILATDETPTVVASGEVDQDTLAAVLAAAEVDDASGELSLRLRSLPDGYSEIVSPRPQGPDFEYRRVLASASGKVGITEVSDMTDPLLAAAMSGADLAAVDIGGGTGWTGGTTTSAVGPLRMLVWSPRPGIVFEIASEDPQLTDDDLVELARATSTIEPAAWDARYRD